MSIDCRNCLDIPFDYGYLHLISIEWINDAKTVSIESPDFFMFLNYPFANSDVAFQFMAEFNLHFLNTIWEKHSDKNYIQSLLHANFYQTLGIDWGETYGSFLESLSRRHNNNPLIKCTLANTSIIDSSVGSFPIFWNAQSIQHYSDAQLGTMRKMGINPKL